MPIFNFLGVCEGTGLLVLGSATVHLEERGGTASVYAFKIEMLEKGRSRLKVLLFDLIGRALILQLFLDLLQCLLLLLLKVYQLLMLIIIRNQIFRFVQKLVLHRLYVGVLHRIFQQNGGVIILR